MSYVTLLIGATDRGKTTLLSAWVRAAAASGARIAVVDADPGQSEIGPPGAIGVAWARPDAERLTDLPAAHTVFVGALSPAPAALEHVAATVAAVHWARQHGAAGVFVDTPGYVVGPGARRWLAALVQALAPQKVTAIATEGELDGLLSVLAPLAGGPIETLTPDPRAVRKPTAVRATRRMTRLARALEDARTLSLPLGDVATLGATLGTGAPIPPHLLRWVSETLRVPLVYGEDAGGAVSLWSPAAVRAGWESRTGLVSESLGARSVRVLSLPTQLGTIVGLHAADSRLLALGRFVDLDPDRRTLRIAAPPPATEESVALVAFGRFRIAEDCQFVGDLKPGEL